jgi:hypothetical protein
MGGSVTQSKRLKRVGRHKEQEICPMLMEEDKLCFVLISYEETDLEEGDLSQMV